MTATTDTAIYKDEVIIRSVTYHGKAGHKISLELDPAGWERLKGMETTRCMMVLVPIQNDGQPDPDAKPYPSDAEVKMLGGSRHDKPRRPMSELGFVMQAGILCNDPKFQEFCGYDNEIDTASYVRTHCGIGSRSELATNEAGQTRWDQLRTEFDATTGKIGRPDERA